MSDWRLRNQKEFLDHKKLFKTHYYQPRTDWEHDHCSFCWEKFTSFDQIGYCTEDYYWWICEECFNDFRRTFSWEVVGLVDRENSNIKENKGK